MPALPSSLTGTIGTWATSFRKETSSNLEESGSELNRLGNYRDKKANGRKSNYAGQFDVSMNERLISRFTQRANQRTEQISMESKIFDSNGVPNNSIDQENIHDKIAKIQETEQDQDFNKERKEAQCRICLGEEEDDEIEENPLISPCS